MVNRGFKLQEFVAHSRSVRCLRIGRKTCQLLLTGGDDHRVNLWAVGQTSSLTSLCGHTSSVECVNFNSAESLVLAGASSGAVKLWDLNEAKLLRTLTGHESKCTAVEFHPFGEFLASSSVDADLKIWDIRKKGCIHTYEGHSLGTETIKFTPDGRWVVSGGRDNTVKVWDLTSGKLLHKFFHDGPISSIDFHPLEFLLATGSADKTVKFWDLETFEMIGSTRVESTGVRAMSFHPDGRTLFCGYDESLKVYSWEPDICHDSVDMGWSTLGDMSLHERKLIGCSYYRNSVGIWASDLSLIRPYGTGTIHGDNDIAEQKPDAQKSDAFSSVGFRSAPDVDAEDIKIIHVDCERPMTPKAAARRLSKVKTPSSTKEQNKAKSTKRTSAVTDSKKRAGGLKSNSFSVPCVVPRETSSDGKEFTKLGRKPSSHAKSSACLSVKPVQIRRASKINYDMERPSSSPATSTCLNGGNETRLNGHVSDTCSRGSTEDNFPTARGAGEMSEQDLSPSSPPDVKTVGAPSNWQSASNMSRLPRSQPISASAVDDSLGRWRQTRKVINGVAVVHGRTRSLVEKFEGREGAFTGEDQIADSSASLDVLCDRVENSTLVNEEPQISGRGLSSPSSENDIIEDLMQSHDSVISSLRSRLKKLKMIWHFWERNDIKGAINTMTKFTDYSAQADVIGVLMEKMDMINLELFSSLLPVLVNLLDCKTERHAKMAVEMLLKLVAIFGRTICSTISAPPPVGVDLHQEERIECCRQCFSHLEKLQRVIPELSRRGGLLAKSGVELNLVLQSLLA